MEESNGDIVYKKLYYVKKKIQISLLNVKALISWDTSTLSWVFNLDDIAIERSQRITSFSDHIDFK